MPAMATVEPTMAKGRIDVRNQATLARMITTRFIVFPTASARSGAGRGQGYRGGGGGASTRYVLPIETGMYS